MARSSTRQQPRTTGSLHDPISRQVAVIAFSPLEEEFFAAGDALAAEHPMEDFADLDDGARPPGLWQQLWCWIRSPRPAQRCASE